MKTPRIVNAVGHIDDGLIRDAAGGAKAIKRNAWLRWGAIAACFAMLVIAGASILPSFFRGDDMPAGTNGRYKIHNIQAENSAIVWAWDYKTIYEQYTGLTLDGTQYGNKGRTVSDELVGELIGMHSVIGYDEIKKEYHTSDFEVYRLKHADKSRYVAVKMEDSFYVFKNDKYDPPSTLGELFALVDIPKALELSRFSENSEGSDAKYFALNDDEYVWNVLADCKEAQFIEDDWWTASDREYLSFTVTSETLGVYKVAMYVTSDGYLWTNMFSYQYLFDIGEEAADKIIRYAKENSSETEYESYRNAITGEITEITDEYILIDDSVLCNDPSDGITYKVLLTDIRISRYTDHGFIGVGDTIRVTYEGETDNQSSNTVESAYSIEKVRIHFYDDEYNSNSNNGEKVTLTSKMNSNEQIPE